MGDFKLAAIVTSLAPGSVCEQPGYTLTGSGLGYYSWLKFHPGQYVNGTEWLPSHSETIYIIVHLTSGLRMPYDSAQSRFAN